MALTADPTAGLQSIARHIVSILPKAGLFEVALIIQKGSATFPLKVMGM
jgi:formate-dependent phosphoribosylglycinamide formyltransferase (GAR transformylase)